MVGEESNRETTRLEGKGEARAPTRNPVHPFPHSVVSGESVVNGDSGFGKPNEEPCIHQRCAATNRGCNGGSSSAWLSDVVACPDTA